MANYRVLVNYDAEKSVFTARAPELPQCLAEGTSRAEALSRVEEEISAQVKNICEHGGTPPRAIDDIPGAATGDLAIKVSRVLHADLLWQARLDGVELDQLMSELLIGALENRRQRGGRRGMAQPQIDDGNNALSERSGNVRRDDSRRRGFGGGGGGGRYHAIMEDRATFVEYVRGLDTPGPAGGGDRRRRRGRGRGFGGPGPQGGGSTGTGSVGGNDGGGGR